jgi:hypothetical protein
MANIGQCRAQTKTAEGKPKDDCSGGEGAIGIIITSQGTVVCIRHRRVVPIFPMFMIFPLDFRHMGFISRYYMSYTHIGILRTMHPS